MRFLPPIYMPTLCTWRKISEQQPTNSSPGKPIRKLPKTLTVALTSSGEDVYNAIATASGASVHRLRITKGSDRSVVPNAKNTTIKDTGLRESSVIHVKDLGMYPHRQFLEIGKKDRGQPNPQSSVTCTDSN